MIAGTTPSLVTVMLPFEPGGGGGGGGVGPDEEPPPQADRASGARSKANNPIFLIFLIFFIRTSH